MYYVKWVLYLFNVRCLWKSLNGQLHGCGIHDETKRLQRLIDRTEAGGTIYFHPGEYLIKQGTHMNKSCTLVGAGRDKCTLRLKYGCHV